MFRKKHLIAFIILLLILPGTVWGQQHSMIARETLRGIKGVKVAVEDIEPEIEREGLTPSLIQTDIELKLRMVGIKVLSAKEKGNEPGNPFIYANVNIAKASGGMYVFNVELELVQNVYLQRNDMLIYAPTWLTAKMGLAPHLNDVKNHIKDLIDEFISAWLSVNPKT